MGDIVLLPTAKGATTPLDLDPKTAELAALTRFEGRASGAPWSDGTLHLPNQFNEARCRRRAGDVAREAVEKQFHRVLSPTHFLKEGVLDPWLRVDMRLCHLLREALDQEGGAHIVIDYVIIIDQLKLRDEAVRAVLLSQLAPLPFENVIFRISHFGSDATATSKDPNCCRSLGDMINNPKRHSITQETRAMEALDKTPDLMRTQHFLDVEMTEVDRFGRRVKDLKPIVSEPKPRKGQTAEQAAENLVRRVTEHARRNEKMRSSLENLHLVRGLDAPRAPAAHPSPRVGAYNRRR